MYHVINEGFCSCVEFAEEIMKKADLDCKINYIQISRYGSVAIRPLNSRLSKRSLIENKFRLLPFWKDAVEADLKEVK